jgi:hypothetical protein
MDFLIVPTIGFQVGIRFGHSQAPTAATDITEGDEQSHGGVDSPPTHRRFRTLLSLDKDSPGHRPIQQLGRLAAQPIFGGLHHQYCRI